MKKAALGIIAVVTVIGMPAFAADMAVKAPPPPPAPVSNWTGFYAGLNAGYAWNNDPVSLATVPTFLSFFLSDFGLTNPLLTSAAATGSFGTHNRDFIGGGQIGYNWQIGASVFGIETDFQGLSGKNSSAVTFVQSRSQALDTQVTTIAASHTVRDLGTLRGRLGVLVVPSFLTYATGGLAYGKVSSSDSIATSEQPNTGSENASTFGSGSALHTGWTAGAGAEWLFAARWSAKLEYLYYDLGSVNYSESMTGIDGGVPVYTLATAASTRINGNIVRVGLNYRLN